VNLPFSSILAFEEMAPVMPSSSAKGSTISAGALRPDLVALGEVMVDEFERLGVEKWLDNSR
jgi:hypothetical protein